MSSSKKLTPEVRMLIAWRLDGIVKEVFWDDLPGHTRDDIRESIRMLRGKINPRDQALAEQILSHGPIEFEVDAEADRFEQDHPR